LGRIDPGGYRYLTIEELGKIKKEVSLSPAKQARR